MTLLVIIVWVLPSVLIGTGLGYWIGRSAPPAAPKTSEGLERAAVLRALLQVVESTEKLSNRVGSHNNQLAEMGREVEETCVNGALEIVQRKIVERIGSFIESNQRLANELVGVRFQLQTQAQELDRTRREARTDPLSGAANRLAFDETLNYLCSKFSCDREPFALVLLDVDHFKWINDTHGHPAGDFVVQHVSTTLRSLVRSTDYVARFGGDEFGILFAKIERATAPTVADRIRQAMAAQSVRLPSGEEVAVTCSMGMALARAGDTPQMLLARADEGLYTAKRGGRNQLHCQDVPASEPGPALPAVVLDWPALAPEPVVPALSMSSSE